LRFRFIFAALVAAAAASRPTRAGAEDAPAPIFGERSFHLIHIPFLDFGPADAGTPPPGALRWTSETAYASTFSATWHPLSFHRDFDLVGRAFTPAEADAIHRAYPEDAVFLLESDLLR
jgi:hypothetical protein